MSGVVPEVTAPFKKYYCSETVRILVIEDQEPLAERIKKVLRSERYQVELAFDGREGLDKLLAEEYDLVILDILLPKLTGFEVLKEVRADGCKTPVLMLTAKDQVQDKVRGLDSGADDYLTKPFAVPELLARVRSLLRRQSDSKLSVLTLGPLQLDTRSQEVRLSSQLISLTPKEYSILEFLLYNKNRVCSRLSIAEHVWGDTFDYYSMTNLVDVHVKNLRKKLRDDNDKKIVRTVHGVGYMVKDSE